MLNTQICFVDAMTVHCVHLNDSAQKAFIQHKDAPKQLVGPDVEGNKETQIENKQSECLGD